MIKASEMGDRGLLSQDEHREQSRLYMKKYRSKPENREKIRQQNAEYRKRKKQESIRQVSEIGSLEQTLDYQGVKIQLLENELSDAQMKIELLEKEIQIPQHYLTLIKQLQNQIENQNQIISQLNQHQCSMSSAASAATVSPSSLQMSSPPSSPSLHYIPNSPTLPSSPYHSPSTSPNLQSQQQHQQQQIILNSSSPSVHPYISNLSNPSSTSSSPLSSSSHFSLVPDSSNASAAGFAGASSKQIKFYSGPPKKSSKPADSNLDLLCNVLENEPYYHVEKNNSLFTNINSYSQLNDSKTSINFVLDNSQLKSH